MPLPAVVGGQVVAMQDPKFLTRRRFLGGALTLVAVPALGACRRGDGAATARDALADAPATSDGHGEIAATPKPIGRWLVPGGTTLSPERYAMLLATMDALIPGDAVSPGATDAHAAWYLDQLLGAFRSQPPRIYAGGPYSGRHGGINAFSSFQPLTRIETLRWRTYLEGSKDASGNAIPEREWNGPVKGLQQHYAEGLDALNAAALKDNGKGLAQIDADAVRTLLDSADETFVQLVYQHAVEGTYGDPVYGGNYQQSGWKAIDYEGDRQPIGYTARQMSHPEEG